MFVLPQLQGIARAPYVRGTQIYACPLFIPAFLLHCGMADPDGVLYRRCLAVTETLMGATNPSPTRAAARIAWVCVRVNQAKRRPLLLFSVNMSWPRGDAPHLIRRSFYTRRIGFTGSLRDLQLPCPSQLSSRWNADDHGCKPYTRIFRREGRHRREV